MGDDPGETTNLWLKHPEIVSKLSALLVQYQERGRSRMEVTEVPS